jgi:hypothetical protein
VPNATQDSNIVIRHVSGTPELRSVEALQKEVWGCDDLDVVRNIETVAPFKHDSFLQFFDYFMHWPLAN